MFSLPLRISVIDTLSYVWISLSAVRQLFLLGVRQKIHSKFEMKAWKDPWIPT